MNLLHVIQGGLFMLLFMEKNQLDEQVSLISFSTNPVKKNFRILWKKVSP
ncbi:hypothetical protein P378_10700 [Desulforamulus profundi]|uniref:Uncharacterized protein n=1 Tax=Desulforamulus profundi TaxID=1383067 RepID=A0A2C6MFU3_9FIRM|nr:hypothetical protein P378_10700 [Desulforamulus profundi]